MDAPAAAGRRAPLLAQGRQLHPLLSEQQLAGELVVGDPDWDGGCFLAAYLRMDRRLSERAQEIQEEGNERRQNTDRAAGQSAAPTIADSIRLLRKQVFALCPLHLLSLGIAFSMCLTVFSFIVPLLQGRLVDGAVDALRRRDSGEEVDAWGELTPPLVAVGVVMLLSYFCEIIVGILFAICGHTTVTRLRIRLFRNLIQQEIAFYDAHVTGELSSRLINDSASLSNLTQFTTQTLIGAAVKFFGSLVAMYGTHAWLALLATVVTPFNTFITKRTGRQVGLYGVVQNHAMAKANAVAIETLGSIRSVQANVGEEYEGELFMDRLNKYLRVIKFTVYIETILRFTAYGLSRARNLAVLGACMHQIVFAELTVGQYTAFNQYVTLYEDGFKNMADIWVNFKQTITSTGKFVQLLLREPSISPEGGRQLAQCIGHVEFREVTFAYQIRPDLTVLKGLSLEAHPGESVALVGESGAGKSTVIRMLERFYDPVGGALLLDHVDFRELSLRWLRAQIGLVEQEPVLFDRPISQNIAYGSARGRDLSEVMHAAKLANAEDFIQQLASGYDTHPGERAARISGGQKQRVAIARAIIRDPKVLLLDEATSALDSENEQAVHQALQTLMKGKTTFIVAHRLSTVKDATRILVMEKGSILESGSHAALVADAESKYASFMRHQLVAPILS